MEERKGVERLFGLVGWWDWLGFRKFAARSSLERTYLRWSAARACVNTFVLVLLLGIAGESAWWLRINAGQSRLNIPT